MATARQRRKGLLIVPEFPYDSFWSYRHIIHLLGRKAAFPPLGLLTFAAYMPEEWDLEVVDLNTTSPSPAALRDKLAAADAGFLSAMSIQKRSLVEILTGPARGLDTPLVLGGPFASSYRDHILNPCTTSDRVLHEGLDVLVWGEAEGSMGPLLEYLDSRPTHASGRPRMLMPRVVSEAAPGSRRYLNDRSVFRPLEGVPLPRWDLVRVRDYHALMIQTTAGCPFRCDFCDIVQFNGGFNRPKPASAVRRELDSILATGFRGPVFSVDDNFIGKPDAIAVILDEMIEFQREHDFPFSFITQASVDLGKEGNEHLIDRMKQAGFESVFLGIENPDEEALRRMNKKQNIKIDIPLTVSKIQDSGIEVLAGFIFGSDEDTPETADRIVEFIERNHIFTAMVGMLTPVPQTPLYERLREEGRLRLAEYTGNNTDDEVQFEPARLSPEALKRGIGDILRRLFLGRALYRRALGTMQAVPPNIFFTRPFRLRYLRAGIASFWRQGLRRLDGDYFRYLLSAAKLDHRRRLEYQDRARTLAGPAHGHVSGNGSAPVDPTTFARLIEMARDYRIRFGRRQTLEEVRSWAAALKERLTAGQLSAADVGVVQSEAAGYLRALMRAHRFPGAELVRAMECAIRGLHYESVTRAVAADGPLPIALRARPGAPMHS